MNVKCFEPINLDYSIETNLLPMSFDSFEMINNFCNEMFDGISVLRIVGSNGSIWDRNLTGVIWCGSGWIKDSKNQYLMDVEQIIMTIDTDKVLLIKRMST